MATSIHLESGLLQRICGEYREMPALRLTVAQAQRLWTLDRDTCAAALAALVKSRCLWRTREGMYVKTGVGEDVCAWRRRPAESVDAR